MNFYILLVFFLVSMAILVITGFRIKEKYEEDDAMLVELRSKLQDTFPEMKNIILLKGDKSYTINKKRVYLCLYDADGKYYNENMLVYVLLHELAHVMCSEIGHTEKFHEIFNGLLEKAIKNNLYNPNIPIIRDYCEYKH